MKISCTPISFQKSFKEKKISKDEFFEMLAENHCDGVDLLDSMEYPWFFSNFKEEKKPSGKRYPTAV